MKKRLKLLSILCLCAFFLTACSLHDYDFSGLAQDTRSRLATAAVLSDADLYTRAKEEIVQNEVLDIYSTTSVTEAVVENFVQKYPALKGYVFYHSLENEGGYDDLISGIEAGGSGVDLLISHSDLVETLTSENLAYNYFPFSYKDKVEADYQIPTAFMYSSTIFLYNKALGVPDVHNIWALTEDIWRGKIIMKDPRNEQVNENFLYMLTTPQWTERLSAAYLDYYGVEWSSGTYTMIAHEWITKFIANCDFSGESSVNVMRGLIDTDEQKIALVGYSKVRKLTAEERKNIGLLAFDANMEGFAGFAFGTYVTVTHDSDCPYTAALFINYILSDEGFSGPGAWNNYVGYHSTNTDIMKATEASTKTSEQSAYSVSGLEDYIVLEDPAFLKNQNDETARVIEEALSGK